MTMTRPDFFLRHYQHYFGKPFDVQTFHADDGADLRLATYDLRFRKFRIYASAGLSEHADRLRGLAECIILDDEQGKDVPQLFVNNLFFILQHNIPMTGPFTIGGLDKLNPDFADYYNKVALYFTLADGFGPGFDRVEAAGESGLVFQAIFISWPEQDFIHRKGAAAFEEKRRAQDEQLWALNRPSCV